PVGIAAERGEGIAKPDAGAVGAVEGARVEDARHRLRARQGHGETHALLVAEGEDLDREGQADTVAVERRYRLDGDDDAEVPVETTGVADRIDVRAEEQRRQVRRGALVAADDV